jgi:hypothetical protein
VVASQQVSELVGKQARHARGARELCDANVVAIGFAKIVYRIGIEVGAKKWKRARITPRVLRSLTATVID